MAVEQPATPMPAPTRAVRAASTPTPQIARIFYAERFNDPLPSWPNNPDGTAWFADDTQYHLFARDPGQFVSIGVPLPRPLNDARVAGQFRKVGGPPGGGYGFVFRDQAAPGERDGRNQGGRYLVVEVGDQGDIGVWQRDETHWVDLLPWTHSDAVRPDQDSNLLLLTTRGSTLRFEVNGELAAELNFDGLPYGGGVGIFVGGDLNEVALEWLRIETVQS